MCAKSNMMEGLFSFSNSEVCFFLFFSGIGAGYCPAVLKSCRVDPYKRFVSAYQISCLLPLTGFHNSLI